MISRSLSSISLGPWTPPGLFSDNYIIWELPPTTLFPNPQYNILQHLLINLKTSKFCARLKKMCNTAD